MVFKQKRTNLCIIGVSEGEKLNRTNTKMYNLSKVSRNKQNPYLHLEMIYQVPGKIDLQWSMLWHILVKLLDFKDEEKNSQGHQVKKKSYKDKIRLASNFLEKHT